MAENDNLEQVKSYLDELKDDSTIPKNVKSIIESIVSILEGDSEPSIKIDKSLNVLEELSEDPNLQSYTRTQIWNIVSMLEKFNT